MPVLLVKEQRKQRREARSRTQYHLLRHSDCQFHEATLIKRALSLLTASSQCIISNNFRPTHDRTRNEKLWIKLTCEGFLLCCWCHHVQKLIPFLSLLLQIFKRPSCLCRLFPERMPTSGPPSIALHLGDSCSSTSATLIAISRFLEQMLPPPPRRPKLRSTAEVAAATMRASSSSASEDYEGSLSPHHYLPLLGARPTRSFSLVKVVIDMVRSLFPRIHSLISPTCQWPALPVVRPRATLSSGRGRVVAGTFFGHKKGRVSFAVQSESQSEPVLLVELAMLTCDLVKEMASGIVRILLECDRVASPSPAAATSKSIKKHSPLWDEPLWTMYCNGHRCGYAVSRRCTKIDLYVLSMVQPVSVGAGVLPPPPSPPLLPAKLCDGSGGAAAGSEVMYMRAKFERVVGSKDSEAFYLINPDSLRHKGSDISGGPELCVFLLRM